MKHSIELMFYLSKRKKEKNKYENYVKRLHTNARLRYNGLAVKEKGTKYSSLVQPMHHATVMFKK